MDIPLHLLTGKDSARLIIAWPSTHVFPPATNLGHKREMRIRHSPRSAPSSQDLKTWAKADYRHYWSAWKQDEFEQFPRIGIAIGPMLENGQFVSPEYIANPLSLELRGRGEGPYTLKMYKEQVAELNHTSDLLRQRFVAGQIGTGPHIDGVVFLRFEQLLRLEIEHCRQRLKLAIASKGKRGKVQPQATWMRIDEAMVQRFRESGYTVRKIETAKPYWELRMEG